MPQRVPISPQCKMNFWATGVKLFFVVSLISSLPGLLSFLPPSSCLLFLLLQNIQLFPFRVKHFFTCPFSGLPRLSPRCYLPSCSPGSHWKGSCGHASETQRQHFFPRSSPWLLFLLHDTRCCARGAR